MILYKYKIFFIFSIFTAIQFCSPNLKAQDTTSNAKLSSYEGIHFLVGFLQNEFYITNEQVGVDLKLFIVTKGKTKLDIHFPDGTTYSGTILQDTVIPVSISNTFYDTISERVVKNAIEITTDNPVVVYAFNSQYHTSDSYSAIPISNWGKEYVVMSVPNDQYTLNTPPPFREDSIINFTPRSSEFLAIAAYDSTIITFKPKVLTEGGKQVYNYYSVKLNKGETYLVKSYPTPMGTGDLTGTLITGNKPFGVLSGHVRTAILQGLPQGKDSKDHLAEMLTPVPSWGTTYISVPFGASPFGDYFRVTCIEPQTHLQVYKSAFPDSYTFIDSLSTLSFQSITTPVIWQADKPIQIAQFMQRTGSNLESHNYDPSMVMLPPREQFVQTVLFTSPGGSAANPMQYTNHYIALVAEQSAIATLFIDNKKVDTISNISNQQILGTNLYWCVINDTLLEGRTHKVTSGTGKFSGIIYGTGEFDSYAMALGSSLVNADLVDEIPPILDVEIDCFTLKGKAYDFGGANSSGIDFLKVLEPETNNFQWVIDPISPNDTIITLSAEVTNIYSPGKLVIEYWDKIGNKGTYTYIFNPIKLDIPPLIDFNIVSWTDSVCINFTIKNQGEDSIDLQSVILPNDSRIAIYFDSSFPKTLNKNDIIQGKICFAPQSTSYNLNDSFQLQFSCGVKKSIPIKAILVAPNLTVSGWDFGNVYLQDTADGFISIKNTGNIALILDSLNYFSNNPQIAIETNNIFVYNLLPDSTLTLPVKFMPIIRGPVIVQLQFANHLKLYNQLEIKGVGVAPDFSSQIIDFSRRRIGINYDSIIQIKNAGNIASVIKFKDFTIKNIDDFNTNSIENINSSVDPLDEYPLNLQFNPIDTSDYQLSANLECDWWRHPLIQIDIKGKGTIPVILTQNVDFDTIAYATQKILTPQIISNLGNEDLTIDSIFVLQGDIQSYIIDFSALKNFKIPIEGSFSLPITFYPQKLGENILMLGIVNDAMPAYKRKVDTVIIRGYAVAPTNLKVDLRIISDMDFTSCLYDTLKVLFINNEPFEISLTKIEYTQNPTDWQLEFLDDYSSLLPIVIPAKGQYELLVRVLFKANQMGEVSFTGLFNDSSSRTSQLLMEPKTNILDIKQLDNIEVSPDEVVPITFSGNILSSTEIPTILNFQLDYNKYVIYLLDSTATIKITDANNNSFIYNLHLSKSAKGINLDWIDQPRLFAKDEKWEITLNFLSVVSEARHTDIVFSISDPNCYSKNESIMEANINEVCLNNFIIITQDTTRSEFSIAPNPVNNLLKIDFYLVKNSYIRIFINDELGKEYILEKNMYLQKGKKSVIYVVDNLTNGKYFLNVQIDNKIESILIILNR